jgi:hypothetical protein
VSESGGVGFLEGDQAAGELEKREMVLGFLRPADQQRPVSVQPGVAGLDDPASGAPAGIGSFEFGLVAAAAQVQAVASGRDKLADPGVGVAAIEAQALRVLG